MEFAMFNPLLSITLKSLLKMNNPFSYLFDMYIIKMNIKIINNTYKMENNLISNNQMNCLIDSMLEKINKKMHDLEEEIKKQEKHITVMMQ
jgi:hypothetical protein